MQPLPARIGESPDQIDTPATIADLDALDRNLRKRIARVLLRPADS